MRYMGQERTSTIMDSAMGKSLQSFWDQVLTICTRTLIGAYLTQMFPDRVGKVILDGVLDAYSYTNGLPMAGLPYDVQDAESTLRGWSAACATSSKCLSSALGNGTAGGVMGVIDGVLNTAHATYDGAIWSQMGLMVNGTIPSDIHAWPFDVITRIIYQYLYGASSWPQLDKAIVGLHTLQNSPSTTALSSRSPSPRLHILSPRVIASHWSAAGKWGSADNAWSQVVYAIGCGDAQRTPPNYTTSNVFEQIISVSQDISQHFGTIISPRWFCHRWSTRAVERLEDFIGATPNFTIKPKNVILVIGNTADPITPFSSAKRLASAARLGNMTRLVEFKAIGHSSGTFYYSSELL
jgi:pimeloyl-ACP methyl ester carboxylesterase